MVIQRIQNLMLFVAAALLTLFIFMPVATLTNAEGATYALSVLGMDVTPAAIGSIDAAAGTASTMHYNFPFIAVGAIVVILPLAAIMRYKNLRSQRIASIASLLITVCYGIAVAIMIWLQAKVIGAQSVVVNISWGLLLGAIVAIIIAIRGIRHDQKLLQSYDRLR